MSRASDVSTSVAVLRPEDAVKHGEIVMGGTREHWVRLVLAAWIVVQCGCSKDRESPVEAKPQPPVDKRAVEAPVPPPELGQTMPGSPGPIRPLPTLWLEPGDLLTSTGATPIRAWVDNHGDPVDALVISALSASLELRSYPDLRLIQTDLVTYNPSRVTTPPDNPSKGSTAPNSTKQETRAYVELRPKTLLRESWYVLSLKNVPKGVQLAPWSAPQPPAGAYASRFHTGSQPVLVRALFCQKAPGNYKSVLEFSENVKSAEGAEGFDTIVQIEQPETQARCRYSASGPVPAASMRWIDEECPGFSGAASWHVRLRPGLESQVGVPVKTFQGDTNIERVLDLKSLPDGDTGCKVWRL